jgi:hypothetical protein
MEGVKSGRGQDWDGLVEEEWKGFSVALPEEESI